MKINNRRQKLNYGHLNANEISPTPLAISVHKIVEFYGKIQCSTIMTIVAQSTLQTPLRYPHLETVVYNGEHPIRGLYRIFFEKIVFKFPFSHKSSKGGKFFSSIVQAVTEVLNKSHFSLQMGNCPIPVAEHFGHY